ncbi:cardiolipin synthase [Profundibacter sp.]
MFIITLHLVLAAAFMVRIFLRNGMLPSSRMAWFMVILALPVVGGALYFLFGETDLGQRANIQQRKIFGIIRKHAVGEFGNPQDLDALIEPQLQACFKYAASINGFYPVGGNKAELACDVQSAWKSLTKDIDAATDTVHMMFYIWLTDKTGTDMAATLIRAARRGVACRVMVDGLGSRAFVRSPLWKQMDDAGVQLAVALPIDRPIRTILTSRLDLRNHRKITVIDGKTAYCASWNCAGPEFAPEAKFGPWVDIVLRLQGPVVAQMQLLFASDWMKEVDTPIECFLGEPSPYKGGFTAQAIGNGPTERSGTSPQLFVTLIDAAQSELTITTPYFVPDPTAIEALCAAAYRQVKVTLIVPQRNNSWVVAAASKSHYKKLLEAGVLIYEFKEGLLHSKILTIDGCAVFLGSSNIDMRSFDLNYENDTLIQDRTLAKAVRKRQQDYISRSDIVDLRDVTSWPYHHRIWNNIIATIGPVL